MPSAVLQKSDDAVIVQRTADRKRVLKIQATRAPRDIAVPSLFGTNVKIANGGDVICPRWVLEREETASKIPVYVLQWQRFPNIMAAYRRYLHEIQSYSTEEGLGDTIEEITRILLPLYRDWEQVQFSEWGVPAIEQQLREIVDKILGVYDPDKVKVRDRLLKIRHQKVIDSLGRTNPQAYAWIVNGIIFRLNQRQRNVAWIQVAHAACRMAILAHWRFQARAFDELAMDARRTMVNIAALPQEKRLELVSSLTQKAKQLHVNPFARIAETVADYATLIFDTLSQEGVWTPRITEQLQTLLGVITVPQQDFARYRNRIRKICAVVQKEHPQPETKEWDELQDALIRLYTVLRHNPSPPWKELAARAADALQEGAQALFRHSDEAQALSHFQHAIERLWLDPKDMLEDPTGVSETPARQSS